MGVKCPHCSEELAGYVPQDELVRRLKAKDDALSELKTQARELAGLRERAAEAETLRAELLEIRGATEREAAYTTHGVVPDAKIRDRLARVYRAEAEGVEGAPSFADWLASEDTRALFAGAYARPAAAPAKSTPPPPAPVTAAKPAARTELGAVTETPARVGHTPETLRAYLASPAYRALPPEERARERARLQAETAAQSTGTTARPPIGA